MIPLYIHNFMSRCFVSALQRCRCSWLSSLCRWFVFLLSFFPVTQFSFADAVQFLIPQFQQCMVRSACVETNGELGWLSSVSLSRFFFQNWGRKKLLLALEEVCVILIIVFYISLCFMAASALASVPSAGMLSGLWGLCLRLSSVLRIWAREELIHAEHKDSVWETNTSAVWLAPSSSSIYFTQFKSLNLFGVIESLVIFSNHLN